MNQAFIQDAEHQVNYHQRSQNQQRLPALLLLSVARRAGKAATHVARQGDVGLGLFDGCLRIAQ